MGEDEAGTPTERDRPFDHEGFFAALNAERVGRRMHWKAVASEAGVSASTLTRIGQGRRPDVDSFAALTSWAGLDAEDFFRSSETTRSESALSGISLLLRRDPNLSKDAAAALDEMVKVTYERLRQQR